MGGELNGVMFQGFHWFLKPELEGKRLWKFLTQEADHLREIGIDSVWIPPAYKPAGNRSNSVGYDAKDHFDLGEFNAEGSVHTKYGTKDELLEAVRALHGQGGQRRIAVYADIVLNHKTGGDVDDWWQAIRVDKENRNLERWDGGYETGMVEIKGWTKFTHPERGGAYSSFTWTSRHFDSVDATSSMRQFGIPGEFNDPQDKYIYRYLYNEAGYDPQNKAFEHWVSLEKGNYDYLTGADIDYGRYDVREEMKFWGAWIANTLELDGVRLDAVKHITADFIREWVGHVRSQRQGTGFAVCEYIDSSTPSLHSFIGRVSNYGDFPQTVNLFDFPLRFKLQAASWQGDRYDLRQLDSGTLMREQPALAMTFVENHDYEYGRNLDSHVQEWFKPLAYAFILLRAGGYPCIFFPDYYGSTDWVENGQLWHLGQKPGRQYLDLLIKLRKQFALGEERYYAEVNVAGWVRMGFVPGAKGAMAVVINNSNGVVKGIRMDTGRANRRFYHLATIKSGSDGFLVVRDKYGVYGDKSEAVWTDGDAWGEFVADGGAVSLWIEDGVGLQ
jgi:alpha-amylase